MATDSDFGNMLNQTFLKPQAGPPKKRLKEHPAILREEKAQPDVRMTRTGPKPSPWMGVK